ncbi:MAG: hypothetical protein A2X52_16000 [Candidatus Rokubacteria bacterium GWC2_70_16]|nr:MAG: hypothetical protein A2X52_16000 [Candidatus Rokubacteria bacterium GWC2_70_16]
MTSARISPPRVIGIPLPPRTAGTTGLAGGLDILRCSSERDLMRLMGLPPGAVARRRVRGIANPAFRDLTPAG